MIREVLLEEVTVKAGVVVVRGEMRQAAERSGDDQAPSRLQQTAQLPHGQHRVRQVLENLHTHDRVEGGIRRRDVAYVADQVQFALVP